MLAFGALVIILRNPVSSAMSLVVSFLCLAALFILLNAYFIGIIQILVYAGAIMVLFLFIIMLLDLRSEKRRPIRYVTFTGGLIVAGFFVAQLVRVLQSWPRIAEPFPAISVSPVDDVRHIGMTLFTNFNLPFQVIAVLLLVATIGVVVLSKRELK